MPSHRLFPAPRRRERGPHEAPEDSPDLAYVMSFVTSVGGLAAYWTLRSTLGLASGLGVGAAFCLGGWWIQVRLPCQECMPVCMATGAPRA